MRHRVSCSSVDRTLLPVAGPSLPAGADESHAEGRRPGPCTHWAATQEGPSSKGSVSTGASELSTSARSLVARSIGAVPGHSDDRVEPEGADGRTTARGITVDRENRVYIAGGPNGIGNDRPDLWVYEADGTLLAALRVGVANAFLNDVAIGPDGAAYFTNSNAPHIYRVALEADAGT